MQAEPRGASDGHRGVHAEPPRFVRRRGDNAPAARIGAHDDGAPAEIGAIALLDGRVEGVHVHVDDRGR